VTPTEAKPAKTKPTETTPAATDKKKQEELLKIVRNTLQQEKSTPDKRVAEKESAKDATAREQQALAERTATLEESLESKRLENKDLSEKVGMVRSQLQKESRLIALESQSLAQQQKSTQPTPAEPVKPVEPPKPVEQPPAPKVESQPKVEPLSPVAKPQPVKPAAPKKRPPPQPAPVEEKSFLATVLEAVQSDLLMPVVIGLVVLLTGGIALVYFRRRQKSIAEFEESILSGEAISTDQTGDSHTQGAVTTGGDTSFLSDFSQGGMGNIHTDEVDPVAEAEVYLAYGRDETAEDILKEAAVKHPERHELKLKLLEIYHQRNDVPAFETLAEELYAALGGRGGKIWEKVELLGRKLNPENPMFRGGAPAGTPSAAPAAVGLATSAETGKQAGAPRPGDAPTKPDSAGDFDFDMETPSVAPAAEPSDFSVAMPKTPPKEDIVSSLDSIDLGTPVDNSVEFGGDNKPDAPDLDFDTPSEEAPADQDVKWEPEPVNAAAPEADNQISSQWDETATKLDLAKAYIDMGDSEGARSILQEVMSEGNDTQKKQAQELSAQLA
jgi:pilus assembly protein FimV